MARGSAGGPPIVRLAGLRIQKGTKGREGTKQDEFFDSWEEVLVGFAGAGWNYCFPGLTPYWHLAHQKTWHGAVLSSARQT